MAIEFSMVRQQLISVTYTHKQEEKEIMDPIAVQGLAHAWKTRLAFIDSMVLRCAVELGLADIIHAQPQPLPSSDLSSLLSLPQTGYPYLDRILRFLARKSIFTAHTDAAGSTVYGPSPASHFLLSSSLAPMVILQTSQLGDTSPWYRLADAVRDGRTPFELAQGIDLWSLTIVNPKINELFNAAMACTIGITLDVVMSAYKEGLEGLGSMVDVGGGTGAALGEITNQFPHIKGINYDRPNVVAGGLEFPGVTHVGGDMFESIPQADAIFMKWLLHCFGDEDCVKILKNCRRAIPEETGKLIITEALLDPKEEGDIQDIRLAYDIIMLTNPGGKERTEDEWKELLALGGFPRYNIIRIPAVTLIIEAFPN